MYCIIFLVPTEHYNQITASPLYTFQIYLDIARPFRLLIIRRWLHFTEMLLSSVPGHQISTLLRRHHVSYVNIIKRVNIPLSFHDVSVCVLSLWTLPLMFFTVDESHRHFCTSFLLQGMRSTKHYLKALQWPSVWSYSSLKHVTLHHTLPQDHLCGKNAT